MKEPSQQTDAQREATSLELIGGFFAVLAVLVLVGTFWARSRPHAMWVNLGAGVVLLVIGLLMLAFSRRLLR